MKQIWKIIVLAVTLSLCLSACGSDKGADNKSTEQTQPEQTQPEQTQPEEAKAPVEEAPVEDGTYLADFDTDSGMFHVNEANDGKGTLTVKDGKMTIHVSLVSKKIEHLFYGTAEDAQKENAKLIDPTVDTVTYEDGTTEEVYGFDIPVPAIDSEFDVALIGTQGKWYDHKVHVSNLEKEE